MPLNFARTITRETTETGRAAYEQSRRAAAVFVTGFVILLAIAGRRFRHRSGSEDQDPDAPAEYFGICPGQLSGSDEGKLPADARGFPPAFFRKRNPA